MTLTEFLLARIAEDERDADNAYQWGTTRKVDGYLSGGYESRAARVLAECYAKRRIVTEARASDTALGDEVLRLLAFTYAEHPDYRAEFAPISP